MSNQNEASSSPDPSAPIGASKLDISSQLRNMPAVAPAEPRGAFGNSIGLVAILLVLAAVSATFAYRRVPASAPDGRAIGMAIGTAIAVILVPLVLGYIGYWISGRRSSVARVVALVAAIFVCLGQVAQARRGANDEVIKQLKALRERGRAEQAEAIRAGDSERAIRAAENAAVEMERLAKEVSGDDAQTMLQLAKFAAGNARRGRTSETALAALTDAGAVDPETMKTKEKMAERLTLLAAAETAYADQLAFLKNAGTNIRTDLQAAGISERQIEAVMKGFQSNARDLQLSTQFVQYNVDACVHFRLILETLHRHHGRWTFTSEGFDFGKDFPEADGAAVINAYQKLGEIETAQNAVQQRMISGG